MGGGEGGAPATSEGHPILGSSQLLLSKNILLGEEQGGKHWKSGWLHEIFPFFSLLNFYIVYRSNHMSAGKFIPPDCSLCDGPLIREEWGTGRNRDPP